MIRETLADLFAALCIFVIGYGLLLLGYGFGL